MAQYGKATQASRFAKLDLRHESENASCVPWNPRDLFDSDDLTWLEMPDREVETPWVERKSKFDKDEIAR